MEIEAKLFRNKKTNQLSIVLPKKKIKLKSKPKKVLLEIKKWI